MKKYTLEELKEINLSYDSQHILIQSDVDNVNKWVDIISNNRNLEQPQVGDIVEFTNKHGDYYRNAHIESVNDNKLNICEQPYVPFVGMDQNRFYTNTSGGAWSSIPSNLKLIGQREKLFQDWGHCGWCANGTVKFYATVNVWEYIEPDALYGECSTKDLDKFYVTVNNDKSYSEYKYIITTSGCSSHKAFKTDDAYRAWLLTYGGVEFDGHWKNQKIVWTLKQIDKCVPIEEYQKIKNAMIDSELCNGAIQECKRIIEGTTIITVLPYQNKMIKLDGVKEYVRAYEKMFA